MIDAEQFEKDSKSGGIPWALKQQFPGVMTGYERQHEELNRLLEMRRRYIAYLQRTQGIGFSEAEHIADHKMP